jgi:predicted nucleic acid-binding protein
LLDTCVISHAAPGRGPESDGIRQWLLHNADRCYLSVVSLMEVESGIAWLRHRGATAKAGRLAAWRDELVQEHASRMIEVDDRIAVRAGELLAVARSNGAAPGGEDALIAATADALGFEMVTFNAAHFTAMGIKTRQPAR